MFAYDESRVLLLLVELSPVRDFDESFPILFVM